MFKPFNSRAATAYKQIDADTGILGADPHQLINLLFDALLQSLMRARGALQSGDIAAKGVAIGKAVRILEEGLKASLNMDQGGELAKNLCSIYDYSILRLTHANLRNDATALAEVSAMIEPVADAWKQIRNSVMSPATNVPNAPATKTGLMRA